MGLPRNTRLLLSATVILTAAAPLCLSQQNSSEFFELHGKVINSVTAEPVSGALVQIPGLASAFTEADGSFSFQGLSRGHYSLLVRKPGFFNHQELGRWIVPETSADVPSGSSAIVELTPEGIIYGEVKDAEGAPLDGVTVRAERWQMSDGRRQLQPDRQTMTDDQGNFRLAELVPGKYLLAFLPPDSGGFVRRGLRQRKSGDEGLGMQFYPGVSDVSAAVPFTISAGAQIHVTHPYQRQRLFRVSGAVRGFSAGDFFSVTITNSSGEPLQRNVRIDPKTGEFQVDGVPAGLYLISATATPRQRPAPRQPFVPLTAFQTIGVSSDLSGVVLALGTAASLDIQLRDETSSQNAAAPRQIVLRLIPKDFSQGGPTLEFPPPPQDRSALPRFTNLAPGTYTVEAFAPQGYVATLRSGSVDLLREDLVIAPGAAPPPIDVTLRDDFAQLNVKLNQKKSAGVLIYSQEYPRRTMLWPFAPGTSSVACPPLPPGNYQLLALTDPSDLEFRNPAAVAPLLSHAVSVSLQPHDNATVSLDALDYTEQPE